MRLPANHFALQPLETRGRADADQCRRVEDRLRHVQKCRPVVVGAETHRDEFVGRGGGIEDDPWEEYLLNLDVPLVAHGSIHAREQAAPRLPHLLIGCGQAQPRISQVTVILEGEPYGLPQRVGRTFRGLCRQTSRQQQNGQAGDEPSARSHSYA